MVPTVAFPPVIPLTFHVTPDLEPGVTLAVNWNVCPTLTVAVEGDRLTFIACARSVDDAATAIVATIND